MNVTDFHPGLLRAKFLFDVGERRPELFAVMSLTQSPGLRVSEYLSCVK